MEYSAHNGQTEPSQKRNVVGPCVCWPPKGSTNFIAVNSFDAENILRNKRNEHFLFDCI